MILSVNVALSIAKEQLIHLSESWTQNQMIRMSPL
jgi:hypothetical protein